MDQPGARSPHPIGLLGLGIYLPERVMTNDEWAEHVDTSDEWIVARTGIHTRRIAGDDESTADLALAAARAALADGAFEPADIDEIILATDTPEGTPHPMNGCSSTSTSMATRVPCCASRPPADKTCWPIPVAL